MNKLKKELKHRIKYTEFKLKKKSLSYFLRSYYQGAQDTLYDVLKEIEDSKYSK